MYSVDVISGPVVSSPSASELAVHLALGDMYDQAEAASIISAAASIARELTGRSVGETTYRLSCQLKAYDRLIIPYPSLSVAVQSVTVDGNVVDQSAYQIQQLGPWRSLKWVSIPSGERLVIEFTSGERALAGNQRALLLILAGDIYRSRESIIPGTAAPASITAQWLASMDRLVYPGPYALEGILL